jgi:predicted nucleic acid-binding protein
MITALDTNILVALWDRDDEWNSVAEAALKSSQARGKLVISGVVFAELLAFPRRKEKFIDQFLDDTDIGVEWAIHESMWRLAGVAYQRYATRRRRSQVSGPRRLLADFLIGAHALEKGYRLLTFDDRVYRAAFPKLTVVNS